MPRLKIRYPDDRVAELEITQAESVIGRDMTCDVTLEDAITSRFHAKLYRDTEGLYWLQDLQSKNGTQVNDQLIATMRIRNGDEIGIGNCLLRFVTEAEPSVILSEGAADTQHAGTSAWGADQRLDLSQHRLEKLYELNERLTGRFDRDDLLGEVLDICADLLRFERAGIAVLAGEGRPLQWVKFEDRRPGATGEFHISRSVVDRALRDGERILITDTEEFDPTASMISNHICSAMCVPMTYLQNVRGVIYGDRVTSAGGYTREDIDFFAALGRLGAMGLANAQLVEEIQKRQQVDAQLRMGRQIQSRLFPAEPLVRPGLTIDALNDPGQKVSGDYYDYFLRDDGLVVIVMADVAGKGIPASLLMANLQAAVHVTMATERDLARTAAALNTLICRNISESRFITAIVGLLDPVRRTLTYVNAGHPAPYLLTGAGRVEKLTMSAGLPLGVESDLQCLPGVIEVTETPATLFLYTDGIPEAENEGGELLGEARLHTWLEANTEQPPAELVVRVRRWIKQFTRNHPQSDDITAMAIRLG